MAQIRNSKMQDIKHKLNESKLFSINDFKLKFPNSGDILVEIIFRGSSKYLFRIEENTVYNPLTATSLAFSGQKKEKVLQTIQKPGNSKNYEVHDHKNIDTCIGEISDWLINLDEDLKYESVFDDINNISDIDEFEKKLDEHFPDETEKFSNIEKESLLEKLNELQKRIEKLEDNQEIEKHIEVIEKSKKELQTYPKKSWWLKFYNRVNNTNQGLILINQLKENFMKLVESFGG